MTTIQNELSLAERAELRQLETVISRGWQTFIQVGEALSQIHEKRLYREDFRTFEEYCQKVWQWSRQRAYQMMDGAKTARVMEEVGVPVVTERQARELKPVAKLVVSAPAEQRPQVAQIAMTQVSRPVTPAPPAATPAPPAKPKKKWSVTLLLTREEATGEPPVGQWTGVYSINGERTTISEPMTLFEIDDAVEAFIARKEGGGQ